MSPSHPTLRLLGLALLLSTSQLQAQDPVTLHAFGPPGSSVERRCLLVVSMADGTCASWDDLELSADEATVELQERHGECVVAVRVFTTEPRDAVTLHVRGQGIDVSGSIALGTDDELATHVTRRGSRLRVSVDGQDQARVHAYWDGGDVELEATERGFEGRVPTDGIVGILARAGNLIGAAVDGRAQQSAVLILPSDLGVPLGGAPRTAAFVIVTDSGGRPSRNVPLQILSERGTLEWLRWRAPGVAGVGLSVTEEVASIDLTVSTGRARNAQELAVSAGWPVSAEFSSPPTVRSDQSWPVHVDAYDLVGQRVLDSDLRIRCGDVILDGAQGECPAAQPGTQRMIVEARVDARWVVLATTSVRVVAPPPPPEVVTEPWLRVGARVGMGIDTWARLTGSAGLEVSAAISDRFWVGASLSYAATPFDARSDQEDGPQRLHTTTHTTDVTAVGHVELLPWLRGRVAAGVSLVRSRATVDGIDAPESDVRFVAFVGVAPIFELGDFWVGGLLGARLVASQRAAFEEAPARFVLEVSGGWQLR